MKPPTILSDIYLLGDSIISAYLLPTIYLGNTALYLNRSVTEVGTN